MGKRGSIFFLALGLSSLALSQPAAQSGEVTLPLADYENLLRSIAPPPAPPEPPPPRKTVGSKTLLTFAASAGDLSASVGAAGGKKTGALKYGPATVETEEHVEESFLRAASAVRVALESGKTESLDFSIPPDC